MFNRCIAAVTGETHTARINLRFLWGAEIIMTTTSSKKVVNVNQDSQKTKNPRPAIKRSRFHTLRVIASVGRELKDGGSILGRMLDLTGNGTYKLTSVKPELKEDNRGTITVGDKTFYRVFASRGQKGLFAALISAYDIFEAQRIWAKKIENTKDFEAWESSADAQRQFEAVELLTGIKVSDEQKKVLYNKYLSDRGLQADDNDETEDGDDK